MQLIALKFLGPLGTKIAGTLALGGVAAIGAEVAERTGFVDRATGALLHLAGLPDRSKDIHVPELPPAKVDAARVGEPVHVGEAPVARTHCPICAAGPSISGIGEALEVKPHAACVAGLEKSAAGLPIIYLGWAKSVSFDPKDQRAPMPTIDDPGMRTPAGLPDIGRLARSLSEWQTYAAGISGVDIGSVSSDCGPYPTINSPGMRDPQFGTPNYGLLSTAQSKWNECAERSRSTQQKVDAAKAEVKALKDAAASKAQKMAAAWSLSRQTKKYTDQIADLQKQQADAATAARQAEIQKQIDTITAQKDQAVQLAEQLKAAQSASASDAMKAQIDALTREIADRGRSPGGMDQYMQMLLLQRLAAPPAAPAAPWVDPSQVAPVYPQPVYAPPQPVVVIDPSAGYGDFDEGLSLMGADESAPMDPETARELGIAGAETIGDATMLLDYRDAFGDEADDLITDISGCMLGSCGLGSSVTGEV